MLVEEDSVDIRHLQEILASSQTATLVACSPPQSASAISVPIKPLVYSEIVTASQPPASSDPSVPAHHGPGSHDFTGDLRLSYQLGNSQIDLVDTQVDPDSLQALDVTSLLTGKENIGIPGQQVSGGSTGTVLYSTEPEQDEDFTHDEAEYNTTDIFPEAKRFTTYSLNPASPGKEVTGHNPLAHLGIEHREVSLSLTQVFNAPSSPVERVHIESSLPPPTPSVSAARTMAKSMSLTTTLLAEQRSPGAHTAKELLREFSGNDATALSIMHSKTNANKNSSTLVNTNTSLASPSPFIRQSHISHCSSDSDIDDIFDSKTDQKRRQAEAARKEGEKQLNKFLAGGPAEVRTKSRRTKKPVKRSSKDSVRQATAEKSLRHEQTDEDETEDDEVDRTPPTQQNCRYRSVIPAPQCTSLPPPPAQLLNKPTEFQSQPLDTWDEFLPHPKRAFRHSKSSQSMHCKAQSGNIQQASPFSALSSSVDFRKSVGSASLKQMVPFNIPHLPPTPPLPQDGKPQGLPKGFPELVKESSNLVVATSQTPTSSLTPIPSSPTTRDHRSSPPPRLLSRIPNNDAPRTPVTARRTNPSAIQSGATIIPETSPAGRGTTLTPAQLLRMSRSAPHVGSGMADLMPVPNPASRSLKRKARYAGMNVDIDEDVESDLKSFAAIQNSQPVLSSREEPDVVDMLGIVQDVGAGVQPDLIEPVPQLLTKKRRKKSYAGKNETRNATHIYTPNQSVISAQPPGLHPSSLEANIATNTRAGSTLSIQLEHTNVSSKRDDVLAHRISSTDIKRSSMRLLSSIGLTTATMSLQTSEIHSVNDKVANNSLPPVSTPNYGLLAAPHRVFALFKDEKLQYHPATILPGGSQTQTRVVFDDETQDILERHCVRSLDLRIGDTVKVDLPHMKKSSWIIKGFPEAEKMPMHDNPFQVRDLSQPSDVYGRCIISVAAKTPGPLTPKGLVEVQVTNIYLVKNMWAQFSERDISSNTTQFPLGAVSASHRLSSPSISMVRSFAGRQTFTPSVSRNPSFSVSHPRNKVFQGMVFALSFGEDENEKRTIAHKITSNGGRIIAVGFEELFHDSFGDESSGSSNNGRDVPIALNMSSVDHSGKLRVKLDAKGLGFAAVIAQHYSRRVKYLQALALGLPCLASKWIDDCVKKCRIVEWEHYLLPAGESAYLGGAVRSRVLPIFKAEAVNFLEIIEDPNRNRIFQGCNLLLLSKHSGEKRKTFAFLAHVLGAEKILNVKSADEVIKVIGSATTEVKWDYVLVEKEKARCTSNGSGPLKSRKGIKVLEEEDFIQSIIFGKLVECIST